MRTGLLVPFFCSIVLGGAAAQVSTPDIRLKEELQAIEAAGSRGTLLVRRGARTLIERHWGPASCGTGTPLTPEHLFDIGSITKILTGAAILKATELQLLTLETTVGEVFPAAPSDKRSITVGQLLAHTSGLPDSIGLDETLVKREFFLEKLFQRPLEKAGEVRYSNSGFILLAAILENRTRMSYERFLRMHLTGPAGVQIGYSVTRDRLACGILRGIPWGSTADYFGPEGPSWYLLGSGGLLSTANDLDLWFRRLLSGRLVGAEPTAMVRSVLSRRDGSGRDIIMTTGSNLIFSSHYEYWPGEDLSIVIFTSSADWPKEKVVPRIRPAIVELAGRTATGKSR